MNKRIHKFLLPLLAILIVFILPVSVYAAKTVTVIQDQISVTDSIGNSAFSDGIVTISASGSLLSSKTNNITVNNTGSSTAQISFQVSVKNAATFKINNVNATSGPYTATVAAGESIAITLVGGSGIGRKTAELQLSNFSYVAQSATVPVVTVTYDSAKGSVSNVANGGTVEATGYQISLTATPANDQHSFLGWYDLDTHEFKGAAATLNCAVPQNMRLHAVFVNTANDDPWFLVGGNYVYRHSEWSAGMTKAQSLETKTMVLMNNGTLPAGNYQVNSGVTLLIPCDVGYSTCIGEPLFTEVKSDELVPSAFRTLTMASGAHITVVSGGTMSIAGMQSRTQPFNGCNTGPQGFVVMPSNTSITVNSTGNLYAWGYITGSKNPDGTVSQGSVTAKSGATVYECFQVRDWRGGTVTDTMIASENEAYKVLPISQYYVQNIEVPLTLEAGALEYVFMSISAGASRSIVGVNVVMQMIGKALAPYVGPDGLFRFASTDTESCLTKDYDESSDRCIYTVDGNLTMESFEIDLKPTVYYFEPSWVSIDAINAVVQGMNTYLDTAKFVLPLNNNITVNCVNDSVLSVNSNVAILPGVQINIAEQAKIVLEEGFSCFVYDRDTWVKTNATEAYIYDRVNVKPLTYAPGKLEGVTRTDADLHDAAILVNGVLQADGDIYSTCVLENGTLVAEKSGANIYSTEYGQVITTPLETPKAETYQYAQSNGGYKSIAITPLWLRNADKTYVETAQPAGEQTTYNYHPIHGFWYAGTHAETTEVTQQASCLLPEQTTTQCPCGYKQVVTTRDPLGHSYETVVTDPTCTTEGSTTYTCTSCDDTYTEVVAATGHTAGADATCTTAQTCTVCGAILVEALGHTEAVDEAVAPTCTETGLTEGSHCETCGEVIVEQEEVPAKGHTDTQTYGAEGFLECDDCSTPLVRLAAIEASADAATELRLKFYIHEELLKDGEGNELPLSAKTVFRNTTKTFALSAIQYDAKRDYYVLTQPVASGEMVDDMTVSFFSGEVQLPIIEADGKSVTEVSRSVMDYAALVIEKSTNQTQINLVKALVTYGGYAQTYFRKTNNTITVDPLAYSILGEVAPALGTVAWDPQHRVAGDNLINITTWNAMLESAIYLRLKFTAESLDGYTFTLQYPYKSGKTVILKEAKLNPTTDAGVANGYWLDIKYIPAAFFDHDYKITISNGTQTQTVTVRVTDYLAGYLSEPGSDAYNLAVAMYNYGKAAEKFFFPNGLNQVEATQ